MKNPGLVIDFAFKTAPEEYGRKDTFFVSRDGGKTYRKIFGAADFPSAIQVIINCWIVDYLLDSDIPEEKRCPSCRNKGKIGEMKFKRISHGSETVARVWYDGDVEMCSDATYGVSYRTDRCSRCGYEETDYA